MTADNGTGHDQAKKQGRKNQDNPKKAKKCRPLEKGKYDAPSLLKIKSVVIISIIGITAMAIWIGTTMELYSYEGGTDNTVMFLHTNIEILVATFAVTLGVTLLGLQFRAQSYSMQTLMRYIKNKVVYCLVVIFIVLISANMALVYMIDTRHPLIADYERFILPTMMGLTVCSLYYLAGYIFYMVERTQLRHMLNSIKDEINCTGVDNIKPSDSDDPGEQEKADRRRGKAFEPFQIWEQVTFKAVADGNMYVFRESIKLMLDARDAFRDREGWEHLSRLTLVFLKPVMLQCARTDRVEMVGHFLNRSAAHIRPILGRDGKLDKEGAGVVDVWTSMMREAITYNNVDVLDECSEAMWVSMEENIGEWEGDEHMVGEVVDFFHAKFSSLVGIAVSDDHHAFMMRYMDFVFRRFVHIVRYERLYVYALSRWEAIMTHSIDAGNYEVFEIGITRMFYYIDDILGDDSPAPQDVKYTNKEAKRPASSIVMLEEFSETLQRLCDRMCNRWDRRYVKALLRKYPSWLRDGAERPDRAWMRIMLESIRRGDSAAFTAGLDAIAGYTVARKELGSLKEYYPTDSRYQDSGHAGVLERSEPIKSGILDGNTLHDLRVGFTARLRRDSAFEPVDRKPLLEEFAGIMEGKLGDV